MRPGQALAALKALRQTQATPAMQGQCESENTPEAQTTKLTEAPFVGSVGSSLGVFQKSPVSRLTTANDETAHSAIMAMDRGLPEGWADRFTCLSARLPPEGLSGAQWAALVNAGLSLADIQAVRLAGFGWGFDDLFAVPVTWARQDQKGVGWFVAEALANGGRIVSADAETIAFTKANGARFTARR